MKRLPQVLLYGIGNHHASLQMTRHNVGAMILQNYLDEFQAKLQQQGNRDLGAHMPQQQQVKCLQTGDNAWKFENVTVDPVLLKETRERLLARLKRKIQLSAANNSDNSNSPQQQQDHNSSLQATLEQQLQEKLSQYIPQPNVDLHFLLPSTSMNLSGGVLRNYCDSQKIFFKRKDRILVLYDDLDLPFGTFKMKGRSGHAGHNGIRDIEKRLGTNKFHRLKIGIHPPDVPSLPGSGKDFVLGKFNREEMKQIDALSEQIRNVCLLGFPHLDVSDLMTQVNTL